MGFEADFGEWKTEFFGQFCMTKCRKMCCDSRNIPLYVNHEELKTLFGDNIDHENFKKLGIKTHNVRWVYSIESDCLCGKFEKSTRKCLIYESRPSSCREYPFLVEKDALVIKSGCSISRGGAEHKRLVEIAALYGKAIVKRR